MDGFLKNVSFIILQDQCLIFVSLCTEREIQVGKVRAVVYLLKISVSPNQPKIENPNSDFKIIPNEVSKNVAVYHCEKNAIALPLDGHFSNCMYIFMILKKPESSLLSRSLVILEGDCPRVNTIYEIDHVS